MQKKLIVYLVRKYLGLEKYECFRFSNQKTSAVYWFSDSQILKTEKKVGSNQVITLSNVSLNWLLDSRCKIVRVPAFELKDYL